MLTGNREREALGTDNLRKPCQISLQYLHKFKVSQTLHMLEISPYFDQHNWL
jgi:hypothetical protein